MAIFFDAPVSPDDATAYTREVPLNLNGNRQLLDAFPLETENDNTVNFSEIVHTNRLARYRSFDGRIHVSERDTGSDKRVKLAPLSTSLSEGEYERLQREFARTGGTRQEALEQAIYNDADQLTNEVLNRLEVAWGDVLMDGKLTISEGGYAGEADYGVPGDQVVAPATAWTDVNAPALTNLLAWHDVYAAKNGPAGSQMTDQATIRLMTQNKEIIAAAVGNTAGRSRINLQELNDLFAAEGLPTLRPAFDESFVNDDGTTFKVITSGKLLFLPPDLSTLGATKMGITATALELVDSNESDLSFEDAPGIVGVVEKVGPPYRKFTFVDAVGMPVLKDARKLLIATVR